MENTKSDLKMATEQLEDEVHGMEVYRIMYETAVCPKLKKLAAQHLAAEKQHALQLTAWVHNYIETAK